jgi:hypothetical protein
MAVRAHSPPLGIAAKCVPQEGGLPGADVWVGLLAPVPVQQGALHVCQHAQQQLMGILLSRSRGTDAHVVLVNAVEIEPAADNLCLPSILALSRHAHSTGRGYLRWAAHMQRSPTHLVARCQEWSELLDVPHDAPAVGQKQGLMIVSGATALSSATPPCSCLPCTPCAGS